MSDEKCSGSCSDCSAECGQRKPDSLIEDANQLSKIGKVIAVVSGKGGVGKSLVTAMLSVISKRRGYSTAVLDADITGPSIPKVFGIKGRAEGSELGIYPKTTKTGIQIMSLNLLVEDETTPVIWRGPVIAGTVKQFWTDVIWGDIDYMFIDMPPGTGDVPLTVFQSIPVDGIVIVTSPQELVSMIVTKAVNMAEKMNIPIIGAVENYSYLNCPDCGKKIEVFGKSNIEQVTEELKIPLLARIPINPDFAKLCDNGCLELFEGDWLENAADKILADQ